MADAALGAPDKHLVYRRVADLHIACINQGFLATLGPGFLALMYQAVDEGPDSILLVSRDGEQIVGFVAGASGMGPIYRRMLHQWPRLVVALLATVLSPRSLLRILDIVRYSRGSAKTSNSLPIAELLSIGVDPTFRGRGHAARLYRSLSDYFRSRNVRRFKIVVGSALEPAHRFYQRMGAVPAAQVEVHSGERSILYVQQVM